MHETCRVSSCPSITVLSLLLLFRSKRSYRSLIVCLEAMATDPDHDFSISIEQKSPEQSRGPSPPLPPRKRNLSAVPSSQQAAEFPVLALQEEDAKADRTLLQTSSISLRQTFDFTIGFLLGLRVVPGQPTGNNSASDRHSSGFSVDWLG